MVPYFKRANVLNFYLKTRFNLYLINSSLKFVTFLNKHTQIVMFKYRNLLYNISYKTIYY